LRRVQFIWTHAVTYRGLGLDRIAHRARLKNLFEKLQVLELAAKGKWAEFCCPDGFILELIREKLSLYQWEFYGFDRIDDLLFKARNRNIPNSTLILLDLNKLHNVYLQRFDVVSCLETIEHTRNYRNAFKNIFMSAKARGYIVGSVPNEIGLIGLTKYFGRKLLRRNPYSSFYEKSHSNELIYILALLMRKDIERFRNLNVEGWSQHFSSD
jgi:SAM-dependent methyltransferase